MRDHVQIGNPALIDAVLCELVHLLMELRGLEFTVASACKYLHGPLDKAGSTFRRSKNGQNRANYVLFLAAFGG